jgi:hypothetical protein
MSALLAMLLLHGCGSSDSATPEQSQWLVVMNAEQANSVPNEDGTYTLMLYGVDDDMLAFTDRPNRLSGRLATADFIAQWNSTFSDSDPNAALLDNNVKVAITMSNPHYIGTTLRVDVRVIGNDPLPASMTDVDLFIDDIVVGCGNGTYPPCGYNPFN